MNGQISERTEGDFKGQGEKQVGMMDGEEWWSCRPGSAVDL